MRPPRDPLSETLPTPPSSPLPEGVFSRDLSPILLPETLPASPVAAAGPAQAVLFRMAFTNEFFVREPEIPDVDVDALWEVFENLNTN